MIAGMRLTAVAAFAVVSVLATFAGGCAHSLESAREDRVVVAVDHGGAEAASGDVVVTEPPPVIIAEPIAAPVSSLPVRSVEPIYAAAPQREASGGGPNVVVNNNITVVGAPAVYGGYGYGGYGYGGYGRSSRGGRADPPRSNGVTTQPWAASGWEGAGRTAAPGQTPHIGGNWAPAPSHGPRQFK